MLYKWDILLYCLLLQGQKVANREYKTVRTTRFRFPMLPIAALSLLELIVIGSCGVEPIDQNVAAKGCLFQFS